ncbi:hypothetical protein DL96DRAFT_1596421 [Flagelloscypha sp. PMI_526]|nr:hypothetical protein DL96DRAFT_1596421 [Flagelloscypha sp. PMI_526]
MILTSNLTFFYLLVLTHQANAYYIRRRRSISSVIAGIVVALVLLLLLLMFVINRRRRRRFNGATLQPVQAVGSQGPTFMTGGTYEAYIPPPPIAGSPYGSPFNQAPGYPNYHTEKPTEPHATFSPPPGFPSHLEGQQSQNAPQSSFQPHAGSPPGYDSASQSTPQPPAPAHAKDGHQDFVGGFRP